MNDQTPLDGDGRIAGMTMPAELALPGKPILIALVGSHAYGTEREGSDLDYRGCFTTPPWDLLSLRPPAETVTHKDPDMAIHEVRKLVKLAAAANPSVMEVLWGEPVLTTWEGNLLREHRKAFLSKRCFQTYGGYATAQIRKAQDGSGGSRGVKHFKREKFLLHTYRLLECGIHVLRHGDLKLRVDDPEELWARASRPLEACLPDFAALDAELRAAWMETELPDDPDWDLIRDVLWTIQSNHL